MGRMYRAVLPSKRATPPLAKAIHSSAEIVGCKYSFFAESLTRAQCKSRSGVTPSNARAPSKTSEQSQAACVRGPIMGTLPSCHFPSKKVSVLDQLLPATTGPPAYSSDAYSPELLATTTERDLFRNHRGLGTSVKTHSRYVPTGTPIER